MFIGNTENIQTLKRYLDMFFSGDPKAPHFLIIAWPQHIGKSSIIKELLKERMGNYFVTDTLHIKDFSEELEKKHNLKLKTITTAETFKTLINDFNYQDIGIRDVNSRLQQSSIGKQKVAFLENIERMIPEAANAFLKTCEEPLPKRLIIATTSNTTQLLDTILSRALTIKFNELSDKELEERIDAQGIFSDNEGLKKLIINMAMGKPGVVQRIADMIDQEPEIQTTLLSLITNLTQWTHRFATHDGLKKLYKKGILDAFIDGRISYCMKNHKEAQGQRWLATKRLMRTNINIDNLLLYWLL